MISISLDRASYAAGDTITAAIGVRENKPLGARSLTATLICSERKLLKTQVMLDKYDFERDREMGQPYSSHMETKTEERARIAFEQEKQICGKHTFSGEENFTVQFALPPSAFPTSHEFGHDNLIHIWTVRVKLDIPMAIDEHAEAEVFVEGL